MSPLSHDKPRGPSPAMRLINNARGIGTAVRDMGRVREISTVLVRHGFGAFVAAMGLGTAARPARTRAESAAALDSVRAPDRAARIRRVIEDLGPTFVKLGQILSTRPDVVPPDIIAELEHLQDDVPPMSWDDVEAVITAELGLPPDEAFAHIEHEPLASASIAQVHRAITHEGAEVAVKVQRPNIAPQIRSDLHILHFLARRAEQVLPELALMDPTGIIDEFDKALSSELDFTHERQHIERFRHNFRTFEGIVIPRVWKELSTPRVLTMEFIRGIKATEAGDRLDVDPDTLAPRMLRALFKMIFQDGYFHGDLHPGNVLVQPDGTIGLIDFGLVGKLTERQRDNILDILIGISRKDYALVARVFYEIGIKVPGISYDYQRFEADVVTLMETHIGDRNISELDIGVFFSDVVEGAIRHHIKMPPTYTMVFKALMTVEGMGKTLAPDINFVEQATPFVRDMLVERYNPRRILREVIDLMSSSSRFMRGVPGTAIQVLEDLARGSLTIRTRSVELQRLAEAHERAGNHLVRAVMAVGFTLAGTMAWDHAGPRVLGLSPLTFTAFVVAAFFGLPLVWRSLTNRL